MRKERMMPKLIDRHQVADQKILKKFKGFRLKRSPHWPKARKAFLALHPKCYACGSTGSPNVHHMYPFHFVVLCGRPDLELDPRNYITLCTLKDNEHHVLLGHLDDYESYNPDVKTFVKTYHGKDSAFIRQDAKFLNAKAHKPIHLELMSKAVKSAFKTMLDKKFKPNPTIMKLVAKTKSVDSARFMKG
jgi:hypothetical protein